MNKNEMKKRVAQAALTYIEADSIVGVGTGSTVDYFIEALATIKHKIEGTVASSIATEKKLRAQGINVFDLNTVNDVPVYVDGADEIDNHLRMIKGGGGALTREKIIATASKKFICIADSSKRVNILAKQFPLPIEVIPMARGLVARECVKLGGSPVYRDGFITDNGNIILDVFDLEILDPLQWENMLNNIVGVVEHGLFAKRAADVLLTCDENGEISTINKYV